MNRYYLESVVYTEHVQIGQTRKQLTHARRVRFHMVLELVRVENGLISLSPRAADPYSPWLVSEAPLVKWERVGLLPAVRNANTSSLPAA